MKHKVFQMIRSMDGEDIQLQLAMQCAPLIAGLKMSNLLIIPRESLPALREILEGSDIAHALLLEKGKKATLLLYCRNQLQQYLARPQILDFLRGQGYDDCSLEWFLASPSHPLSESYGKGRSLSPRDGHRSGISAGGCGRLYPQFRRAFSLTAATGRFTGNLPEKLRLFRYYENAREHLVRLGIRGQGICPKSSPVMVTRERERTTIRLWRSAKPSGSSLPGWHKKKL